MHKTSESLSSISSFVKTEMILSFAFLEASKDFAKIDGANISIL
jgi:hypothetical protein